MRKSLLTLSLLVVLGSTVLGQVRSGAASRIRFGSTLPATCNDTIGQVFFLVSPGSPVGLYQCLSTDTWTATMGSVTGTGSDNQIAVFTAASDIEGVTQFRYDSSTRTMTMINPGVGSNTSGAGGENKVQIYSRDDALAGRWLELFADGNDAIVRANRDAGGGLFDLILRTDSGDIDFFVDSVHRWEILSVTSGAFEFQAVLANGPGLEWEAASLTNPTLIPNAGASGDDTTGIGADPGGGVLSLITGGVEALSLNANQQADFILGTAALPSIIFDADVDTGIYKNSTSVLFTSSANAIAGYSRDGGGNERFLMSNDTVLVWCSGSAQGCGPQFGLTREAADHGLGNASGDLYLSNSHWSVYNVRTGTTASTTSYSRTSTRFNTDTISGITGASATTVATLIPDGALVLGVTTEIDVALGTTNGTTGYQVGDGTDADRWGDITGTAINTFSDNADFTGTGVDIFTAAQAVTITAVGGNFDGTGDIEVRVHYIEVGNRR